MLDINLKYGKNFARQMLFIQDKKYIVLKIIECICKSIS